MKVNVTKARAHVAVHLELSGSLRAGPIRAGCPKLVTSYEIESPDDTSRVTAMLKNARNGCWVRTAITNPVQLEDFITLHSQAFDTNDCPPRGRD